MITWTFEGMEIAFRSKPENLARDIQKMALANKISPETKTRIIDGNVNNIVSPATASSDGDTSTTPLETVPVVPTKNKGGKTPVLSPVPDDLDDTSNSTDVLGLSDPGSDPDESGVWLYGE